MSRSALLIVVLSLSLAFTLGLLSRPRPGSPAPEYDEQVAAARIARRALEEAPLPKQTYALIARRLMPSVVSIHGRGKEGVSSSGSGVILDRGGHILTNLHVIQGMNKVVVTLSSHDRYLARVVGIDEPTDLAVLHVEATGLEPVTFGDSETLLVGEEVLAIGNALGFGWTVTHGIVSSLHRSSASLDGEAPGSYQDFIQTDATMNPGNSGGPLVNLEGEVVGINSLIVSGERAGGAIGFSIPSRDAVFVARELLLKGRVERGFLGVKGTDVRELSRRRRSEERIGVAHGVLVTYVKPGAPAAKAGVRVGDVILALDGRAVPDHHALRNRIARTPVDTVVDLSILRKGEEFSLRVLLSRLAES